MTFRTFTVRIGSLELDASAEITGEFRPAQISGPPERCYPEESPEIDVVGLTVGGTDLSGLLDDEDILESVHAQILGRLAEAERDGDPDAYDKWRDRQMERKA